MKTLIATTELTCTMCGTPIHVDSKYVTDGDYAYCSGACALEFEQS